MRRVGGWAAWASEGGGRRLTGHGDGRRGREGHGIKDQSGAKGKPRARLRGNERAPLVCTAGP